MNALDRLFLERAYELAERATGSTSPNPAVGAVVVRDGSITGEGFHHRAGEPHAEVHALRAAGERARGATLYVSLEPCNHHGRTPPCSHAVVEAGIARVVAGIADPNPVTDGGGECYLRDRGIDIEFAGDLRGRRIIEPFARSVTSQRPYVTLKMAMSLDGYIALQPGRQEWLTGDEARAYVRELRIAHDAVAVGAGTIRVDNPQLTVRPAHHRLLPYTRVVVCESDSVDPGSAVFTPHEGYARTIVLAPAASRDRFAELKGVADVVFVGDKSRPQLDVSGALRALRARGITSILCEGGPTFAGILLQEDLVDRVQWLIAPRLLRSETSVPVITAGSLSASRGLHLDRVETLGADILISGSIEDV